MLYGFIIDNSPILCKIVPVQINIFIFQPFKNRRKIVTKRNYLKHCLVVSLVLAFVVSFSMAASASTPGSPAKAPAKSAAQLVNINTADTAQLSSLPGIGPSLAQRIVKYRKESGAFKTPQDLGKVKGIGEKKLAKILGKITVK